MGIKLAYGMRMGHVVHISELAQEEGGEKCNCTCPVCNGTLVAKLKDDRRQRHFAHKASTECNVSHAQESGLHLLAKEIILENNRILVPELVISRQEVSLGATDWSASAAVNINLPTIHASSVGYGSVDIEKKIGDIIADAVIVINKKPCIVEIAVSHFVDEDKLEKLEALGIPAFEINLSDLLETAQTRESIATAVLSNETNRKWVFNPKRDRLLKVKRAEFQKKYGIIVHEREQKEKRRREYLNSNLQALQKMMEPESYVEELLRLRDDPMAAWWLKRFAFSKGLSTYPFYMDIPITGEFVFSCDRRIWQGKLFEDYVFQGFGEELCIFNISQIRRRIFKGNLIIHYDKKKTYTTMIKINGRTQDISLSYDVVQRYFDYLDLLGFVSHNGNEWFSIRPISLSPPNHQVAWVLNEILTSVDCSSPDIDQIIKNELLSRLGDREKAKILAWDQR